MRLAIALLAISDVLCGCATPRQIGTFDSTGFTHATYPYAVRTPGGERVLPREWQLDNFQLDSNGRPIAPRVGPDYEYSLSIDDDGNGMPDTRETLHRYDLRYRNLRDGSLIWLRSIPVSTDRGQIDLRVLMREYVDAVSGTGAVLVDLGGAVGVSERRFATRIVEEEPITLHGMEGFVATFEVANVDQMSLSAASRWERAQVVIVRAPFRYERRYALGQNRPPSPLPVYLVAGYRNLPEYFESQLPIFRTFVAGIRFRNAPPNVPVGVQSRRPPPPPPPPPAPPPPPVEPVPPVEASPPLDPELSGTL